MKAIPILALSVIACSAQATTFQLVPAKLDNGYTVTGTLDTDGTLGYLAPANIVKWSITVTQTTDTVYTDTAYTPPANEDTTVVVTAAPDTTGVSSSGAKLLVQRSPDVFNFADGGSFIFRGPGYYMSAIVADFTNYTSWYYPDSIIGGVGGWTTPLGLNLVGPVTPALCPSLSGRCSPYIAATVTTQPNVFKIKPLTVQPSVPLMTLSGTLTTDGTIGPLAPANFTAWHIVGRLREFRKYTELNSKLLNVAGTYTDNTVLKVDNNPNRIPGLLEIGLPTVNPNLLGISVKLADFTDPAYPGGVASYFYRNFGLLASKSPLTQWKTYVVARVK